MQRSWISQYQEPSDLHKQVIKFIDTERTKGESAFTYPAFLDKLDILPSTPQHWKTCKPLNLKILETVKAWCDQTIFNSIKNEPKLVFEYWKLTKDDNKEVTERNTEKFIEVDSFGDQDEFSPK